MYRFVRLHVRRQQSRQWTIAGDKLRYCLPAPRSSDLSNFDFQLPDSRYHWQPRLRRNQLRLRCGSRLPLWQYSLGLWEPSLNNIEALVQMDRAWIC